MLNRAPVEIEGYEFSAEYRLSPSWRFNALYSHTEGHTTQAGAPNGPLSLEMGVVNISPDKLSGSVEWNFLDRAHGGPRRDGAARPRHQRRQGRRRAHARLHAVRPDGELRHGEATAAFSLGVENLTDKFYFLSFSQIDFFRNYFAGRGRTVSLTYRIDF